MDATKVIIENWPPPEIWYIKHIPTFIAIIIAICALIVSICSLCWGRKQFKDSTRPYVWFLDRADPDGKLTPQAILFSVLNSPARIKKIECDFYYISEGKKINFHHDEDSNKVRFPKPQSEWNYVVGEFSEKLEKLPENVKLKRNIRIDYSSLSGKENYLYESESEYNLEENKWNTIYEKAL